MKKNKLITLLKTFSKEEMKKFEKFIASPYFNNERNFKPLYKILKQYHPTFDNPALTEEKIFKKLYPEKTYDEKSALSMRVLESQMAGMVEKFLYHESLETNAPRMVERTLTYALLHYGFYEETIKAAHKNIEINKKEKLHWSLFEYLIYYNSYVLSAHLELNNPISCGKVQDNMSFYFFGYIFNQLSLFISNNINIKRRYNLDTKGINTFKLLLSGFDPVLFDSEFEEDEIGTKEFIFLNYYLCKALTDNNDDNSLNKAIEIFKRTHEKLADAQSIFARLHNICKSRAYEIDFQKYGMIDNELSNFAWEKEMYNFVYDTIIATAYDSIFEFKIPFLNAKELKSFIDKYSVKISSDAREEMKNYSYAWVYFKQKEFAKALELLSKIRIVDISFKDNLYKLKSAILIELGFYDEALLTIDAYEHYLNNNKNVSHLTKCSGKTFTSSIKILVKVYTGIKENSGFELEKLIEDNRNSIYGEWFREKTESEVNIP